MGRFFALTLGAGSIRQTTVEIRRLVVCRSDPDRVDMSIATKTGDHGTTGLMYNRRVSKTDPRVVACGGVDELNAALGFARASTGETQVRGGLLEIQKDLIILMGELATKEEDHDRYRKDGYSTISRMQVSRLDRMVTELESKGRHFEGWALPGSNAVSASFDLARVTCRRAERDVCRLHEQGLISNQNVLSYLNRLGDVLWLMARFVEPEMPEV